VLIPADGASRGPVEAVSLPEDEAAAQTPGRLHAEPFRHRPERAGNVGKMIGDLLLRDSDETRELGGAAWAFAEVAQERFTDGDRALYRWALTSWRSHPARVLHLGPIAPRRLGQPTCSRSERRRIHVHHPGHADLGCPPP